MNTKRPTEMMEIVGLPDNNLGNVAYIEKLRGYSQEVCSNVEMYVVMLIGNITVQNWCDIIVIAA